MGRKGIITVLVGAMIVGAVIGYGIGQSALGATLGAVVGAAIVAIGLALIELEPGKVGMALSEVWLILASFGDIATCCSFFGVFSLASIVTLGGLLLWHSLTLAALAGVGVMTVLLVVVSIWARSYKDASAQSA